MASDGQKILDFVRLSNAMRLSATMWCIAAGLYLIAVPILRGQCPGGTPSDTTYSPTAPQVPGYSAEFPGDQTSYFKVTRVVGPGVGDELDSDRNLHHQNWVTYVQNGVVDAYANLTINGSLLLPKGFYAFLNPLGDPSFVARGEARLQFRFNNIPIGDTYLLSASMTKDQFDDPNRSGTGASFKRCVKVSTKFLRFARKLPENGGTACGANTGYVSGTDTTCPDVNEISVSYSFRWGSGNSLPASVPFLPFTATPTNILNVVQINGFATSLSFKAMAPVFMVHGIRAGPAPTIPPGYTSRLPDWFEPYQYAPGGPNVYQGAWFNQPFIDAKIPHMSLSFAEDRIDPGGQAVSSAIRVALAQYGAKWCHIVAHSMGGLWSRKFLELNFGQGRSPGFGVHSVTTLDTPHHGSYNAAYAVAIRRAADNGAHLTKEQWIINKYAPFSPGTTDLAPDRVEQFNLSNTSAIPDRTKVGGVWNYLSRYAIWSDANSDDSCEGQSGAPAPSGPPPASAPCSSIHPPTITQFPNNPDEQHGYEYPDPDVTGLKRVKNVGEYLYRGMSQFRDAQFSCVWDPAGVQEGCVVQVKQFADLNDFNVTRTSARHEKFDELASFRHNHTTVGALDVGQQVLNAIRYAERYLR